MIYVLSPSYNDSKNFKNLLQNISGSLKGERYKVIIVNDGSTDDTKKIIRNLKNKYPIHLIGYSKNKGPGFAFKYGFNFLIPKLKDEDIVITMESDNTSDYQIIRKMLKSLKNYDVVLASPFAKGGALIGMDPTRIFLSYAAAVLDALIFRIKNVKTYSSFFRAYKAPILKKLKGKYRESFITDPGFTSIVELLIKLSKIQAKFTEVPAKIDWTKRQDKSKMKITKTIKRHFNLYKEYLLGKYDL